MEAVWWALFVGWIGSVVFGLIALVAWKLDCQREPERPLTTPLPMTDREPSASAGSFGAMNPLAGDVSQDREGRLTVRQRIRVNH